MPNTEDDSLFLAIPEKDSLHNVTSPMITCTFLVLMLAPLIDGVIVRDFAFTDERHYGIYPSNQVVQGDPSLPIQGNDLKELLTKLSLDLTQLLQTQVSLSTLISNTNRTSKSELEMDIKFGQELVVVDQQADSKLGQYARAEASHDQMTGDRWASMDDDVDDQVAYLEIKYEPELKDFAATIQGFQKEKFSRDDWLLCLKIRARGRLEGVGHTMRGEAKVELEDIGLVPKQKE